MNLSNYAYNQDGRWYINPQVSLDEQNAFINNLRNLQAQDNAQIVQQTRGLGMQVPSQLGGLVGGEGYFRSRYQTPQTNQTIADLRTVMQSQALNTALQNIISQKQKEYKDAYRAAQERSSNNTSNETTNLYDQLEGKLKVNGEGTTPTDPITINDDVVNPGDVAFDSGSNTTYYVDEDGKKWRVATPSAGEGFMIDSRGGYSVTPPEEGETFDFNGRTYVYTKNGWLRIEGEYTGESEN